MKTIRHPEEILLPDFGKREIMDIVEDVYMEAAITSERARSISNHLVDRYIEAKEELEREAEIRYLKQKNQNLQIELA